MNPAVGEDDAILAAPFRHRLGRPPDSPQVVFKIVGVNLFAKIPDIGLQGFGRCFVQLEHGVADIRIVRRTVKALMVFEYRAGQLRGKHAQAVVALLGAHFQFAQPSVVPDEARRKQQDEREERAHDVELPAVLFPDVIEVKGCGALSNGG